MPELRKLAMTEEEAIECHRAALWQMTPPEEEEDRIMGECVVQLIRARSKHYTVIRKALKEQKEKIDVLHERRPTPWKEIDVAEGVRKGLERAIDAMRQGEEEEHLESIPQS